MTPQLPWDLEISVQEQVLSVEMAFDGESGVLNSTLRNESAASLRPGVVRLAAEVRSGAAGGLVWLQGRSMHEDSLVHQFGASHPDEATYGGGFRRVEGDRVVLRSQDVVALSVPSRPSPALLVGATDLGRYRVDIEIETTAGELEIERIGITFDLEGETLAPGEEVELPGIALLPGSDPQALIAKYARLTGARHGARVPARPPTGWCSWYFYYNRVSEADILANLGAMGPQEHPEVVQIDDGFQRATGDWLTGNERFPSGMAAPAKHIRQSGRRPGLWLAPMVMHRDSSVLQEHPEFALRTHSGEPILVETWLGQCAIVDATRPAAREWLAHVVRTVVHEWGYDYLKLDALTFAAVSSADASYHEPGTTGTAHLRGALQTIREAAGDDTFLLGCTCPFGAAIGIVDAMRVGPDVKATWFDGTAPSLKHAMRMTLQRNWMHGNWWANDPDCLLVRERDGELTEAERRFLATAIALSGGMVVESDDLTALGPEQFAVAQAMFPPPGVAARSLDLAEAPVASFWRAELGEGRALAGALNWSDEERWVSPGRLLRPGEVAFDAWAGRVASGGDALLPPHGGALWQITGAVPSPRLVGDTGSLRYEGLERRQVSGQLHLRNTATLPRTVAVDVRGSIRIARLEPGELQRFW